MQQKLGQFFLQQESGAFGNNIRKEPSQELRPKLTNMYIIYLLRVFALSANQRKW